MNHSRGNEHSGRAEHCKALARQRPGNASLQHFQPALRRCQMISIKNSQSVARQERRQLAAQPVNHGSQLFCAVRRQRRTDSGFHAVELVVHGRH